MATCHSTPRVALGLPGSDCYSGSPQQRQSPPPALAHGLLVDTRPELAQVEGVDNRSHVPDAPRSRPGPRPSHMAVEPALRTRLTSFTQMTKGGRAARKCTMGTRGRGLS